MRKVEVDVTDKLTSDGASAIYQHHLQDQENDICFKTPLLLRCQKGKQELDIEPSQNIESPAFYNVPQTFDFIVLPGVNLNGNIHCRPLIGAVRNIDVARCSSSLIRDSHRRSSRSSHTPSQICFDRAKSEIDNSVRNKSDTVTLCQKPYHCTTVESSQGSRLPVVKSISWHAGLEKRYCQLKITDHKTLKSPKKASLNRSVSVNKHTVFNKRACITGVVRCLCEKSGDQGSDNRFADPLYPIKESITIDNLETGGLSRTIPVPDKATLQGLGCESFEFPFVTYDMMEPVVAVNASSTQVNLVSEDPAIEYDPIYKCAFEFAKRRGYGFVEFVEERPDEAQTKKRVGRKKVRIPLAKRDDRSNPVHAVVSASKNIGPRRRHCLAKPGVNLLGLSEEKQFTEPVEQDNVQIMHEESDLNKIKAQSPTLKTSCPDLRKEPSPQKNRHRIHSKTKLFISTSGMQKFGLESPEECHERRDDATQSSSLGDFKDNASNKRQKGSRKNLESYNNILIRSKSTGVGDVLSISERKSKLDKTITYHNTSFGSQLANNISGEKNKSELTINYPNSKMNIEESRNMVLDTNTSKKNASDSDEKLWTIFSDTHDEEASFCSESRSVLPHLKEETSLQYKLCNSISATIFRETQATQKTFNKTTHSGNLSLANMDIVHFDHTQTQCDESDSETSGLYSTTYSRRKLKFPQYGMAPFSSVSKCGRRRPQVLLDDTQGCQWKGDKAESWPALKIHNTGGLFLSNKAQMPMSRSPVVNRMRRAVGDSPTVSECTCHRPSDILPNVFISESETGAREIGLKCPDGSSMKEGIYPERLLQDRYKLHQNFGTHLLEDCDVTDTISSLSCTSKSSKDSLDDKLTEDTFDAPLCVERSEMIVKNMNDIGFKDASNNDARCNDATKSDLWCKDIPKNDGEWSYSKDESTHSHPPDYEDTNNSALPNIQQLHAKNNLNSFVSHRMDYSPNMFHEHATRNVGVTHRQINQCRLPDVSHKNSSKGYPYYHCIQRSRERALMPGCTTQLSYTICTRDHHKLLRNSFKMDDINTNKEKLSVISVRSSDCLQNCKSISGKGVIDGVSQKFVTRTLASEHGNKLFSAGNQTGAGNQTRADELSTTAKLNMSRSITEYNNNGFGNRGSTNTEIESNLPTPKENNDTTIYCIASSNSGEEHHLPSLFPAKNLTALNNSANIRPGNSSIIARDKIVKGSIALVEQSALNVVSTNRGYGCVPPSGLSSQSQCVAEKGLKNQELSVGIGRKLSQNSTQETYNTCFECCKTSNEGGNINNSAKRKSDDNEDSPNELEYSKESVPWVEPNIDMFLACSHHIKSADEICLRPHNVGSRIYSLEMVTSKTYPGDEKHSCTNSWSSSGGREVTDGDLMYSVTAHEDGDEKVNSLEAEKPSVTCDLPLLHRVTSLGAVCVETRGDVNGNNTIRHRKCLDINNAGNVRSRRRVRRQKKIFNHKTNNKGTLLKHSRKLNVQQKLQNTHTQSRMICTEVGLPSTELTKEEEFEICHVCQTPLPYQYGNPHKRHHFEKCMSLLNTKPPQNDITILFGPSTEQHCASASYNTEIVTPQRQEAEIYPNVNNTNLSPFHSTGQSGIGDNHAICQDAVVETSFGCKACGKYVHMVGRHFNTGSFQFEHDVLQEIQTPSNENIVRVSSFQKLVEDTLNRTHCYGNNNAATHQHENGGRCCIEPLSSRFYTPSGHALEQYTPRETSLVVSRYKLQNECSADCTHQKEPNRDKYAEKSDSFSKFPFIQFNEITHQNVGSHYYAVRTLLPKCMSLPTHFERKIKQQKQDQNGKKRSSQTTLIRSGPRNKIPSCLCTNNNNSRGSRSKNVVRRKMLARQLHKQRRAEKKTCRKRRIKQITYIISHQGRRYLLNRDMNIATYKIGPEGHIYLYKLLRKRYDTLRYPLPSIDSVHCTPSVYCSCNLIDNIVGSFRNLITMFPESRLKTLQRILGRDPQLQSRGSRRTLKSTNCFCNYLKSKSSEDINRCQYRNDLRLQRPYTFYHSVNRSPNAFSSNNTSIISTQACDCCSVCMDNNVKPVDSLIVARKRLFDSKSKNISKNACYREGSNVQDNKPTYKGNKRDRNILMMFKKSSQKPEQVSRLMNMRKRECVDLDTSSAVWNREHQRYTAWPTKMREKTCPSFTKNDNQMKSIIWKQSYNAGTLDSKKQMHSPSRQAEASNHLSYDASWIDVHRLHTRRKSAFKSCSVNTVDDMHSLKTRSRFDVLNTLEYQHRQENEMQVINMDELRQQTKSHCESLAESVWGGCTPSLRSDSKDDMRASEVPSSETRSCTGQPEAMHNCNTKISIMHNLVNEFFSSFTKNVKGDITNKDITERVQENTGLVVNNNVWPTQANIDIDSRSTVQPLVDMAICEAMEVHRDDKQDANDDALVLPGMVSCLHGETLTQIHPKFVDQERYTNIMVSNGLDKTADHTCVTPQKCISDDRGSVANLDVKNEMWKFQKQYMKVNPSGISTKWVCIVPKSSFPAVCSVEPGNSPIPCPNCSFSCHYAADCDATDTRTESLVTRSDVQNLNGTNDVTDMTLGMSSSNSVISDSMDNNAADDGVQTMLSGDLAATAVSEIARQEGKYTDSPIASTSKECNNNNTRMLHASSVSHRASGRINKQLVEAVPSTCRVGRRSSNVLRTVTRKSGQTETKPNNIHNVGSVDSYSSVRHNSTHSWMDCRHDNTHIPLFLGSSMDGSSVSKKRYSLKTLPAASSASKIPKLRPCVSPLHVLTSRYDAPAGRMSQIKITSNRRCNRRKTNASEKPK